MAAADGVRAAGRISRTDAAVISRTDAAVISRVATEVTTAMAMATRAVERQAAADAPRPGMLSQVVMVAAAVAEVMSPLDTLLHPIILLHLSMLIRPITGVEVALPAIRRMELPITATRVPS